MPPTFGKEKTMTQLRLRAGALFPRAPFYRFPGQVPPNRPACCDRHLHTASQEQAR